MMDASLNIASHLGSIAAKRPHDRAVVAPAGRDRSGRVSYTHYTFRQLHTESDRLARGLQALDLCRGMRVVLMVKPGLDFFALSFALLKLGAVSVLIDPGMGTAKLGKCIGEATPGAFIGIAKAQLARALLGWGRPTVQINVTVGRHLWGGITLDQARRLGEDSTPIEPAPVGADEPAAILFTSGSTGSPKGVVYTHRVFTAQLEALRRTYGLEPGEIDLSTFPLLALFAPVLGVTAVVADMDFTRPARVNPEQIREAIDNFGVTSMFGSPALLDRVGRWAEKRSVTFPSLRRVISAGAPVPAVVLERFARLLSPGAQVHTPYGATEALPVCSIGSDEILRSCRALTDRGAGVCVGRPVEGVRVAVIAITDGPISRWSKDLTVPVGQVGEIVVQGPVVTREYFNQPEATALAKIPDPESGGFYHRMGDLGYLDDHGRVWFCGRKAQRVTTPNGTLFTVPCEAVFNTHPEVFRTALVGVGGGAGRYEPVLCVELEQKRRRKERQRIAGELLALGSAYGHTRDVRAVLFHPSFPVDARHNAKIDRAELARWATRKLGCGC
jgi:acyl-CoA synthetase (AMP-forming)/AMP-acid ligase II